MSTYKIGKSHRSPPTVLKGRDIASLAKYLKSAKCENVVVMASVLLPESLTFVLLGRAFMLNLPRPEAVFEIGFFRRDPVPFYTLAHELYPGKFRPTLTHSFIRLLHEKGLLYVCFTQNIDTLERRAGVPDNKIIEAHGSFANQRCIDCKRPFDDAKMKQHILDKKIAHCEKCNGYVKPDIVFFGESLPPEFINSIPKMYSADLLIVMGTSLTVHPFASLAELTSDQCPRVLINLDQVGDFGDHPDDLILLGQCDDIIVELCKELGWESDLRRLWAETEDSVLTDKEKKERKAKRNKGKPYIPDESGWGSEDAEGEPDPEVEREGKGAAQEDQDKPDVLKELEDNLAKLAVDDEKKSDSKPSQAPRPEDTREESSPQGSKDDPVLEIPADPSKASNPSTKR